MFKRVLCFRKWFKIPQTCRNVPSGELGVISYVIADVLGTA